MVEVCIEDLLIQALVDTGAAVSVMRYDLCRRLKKVTTPCTGLVLQTAGKQNLMPISRCTTRLSLGGVFHVVEFFVLASCSHEIILGWDFLSKASAIIDCSHSTIELSEVLPPAFPEPSNSYKVFVAEDTVIPPYSSMSVVVSSSDPIQSDVLISPSKPTFAKTGLLTPYSFATFANKEALIMVTNSSSSNCLLPSGLVLGTATISDTLQVVALAQQTDNTGVTTTTSPSSPHLLETINPNLNKDQREKLYAILHKHSKCFDVGQLAPGQAISTKHRIDVGEQQPLRQRPYRVSLAERNMIDDQVSEMLRKGVVRPSSSPWASPVVLVKKKDGTIRFCVDYRRLNRITKKDVYPMPRIDDALDCLQGAEYFSTMDLHSGYWQVPMAEDDKQKTAFSTPDGLFEFNVMPFGLCNAPATFERLMDNVLRGLKWKICLCYLDDVVIFSRTFEEHLSRINTVLNCVANAGLQLNTRKCHFGCTQILILGHVVSPEGIRPDPDKIRAVSDFPPPQNEKNVRSFLGLCSYFRRFVRGFAGIAAPLHDPLKKNTPFAWTTDCEHSFHRLKQLLTSDPILRHFDNTAMTELHTDASGFGLGAVLTQRKQHYDTYVVAYASRTLTKPERNYSTTEKEGLAIVWAIAKFRPYLYGRHFDVVTDHHALCWLSSLKDPSGRLGRWMLRLQEYDYTVLYKSGKKHGDADSLSRCPLPDLPLTDTSDVEDPLFILPLSLHSVASQQILDPYTSRILNHLNGTHTSSNRAFLRSVHHFQIRDGLLYRRNYLPQGNRWLLCIPQELRGDVLRSLHSEPTSGHAGFLKTYRRISQRYFWPRLYRSVQSFVQSCPDCQRHKRPPQSPTGLLQPLPCPERPFQRVGIDLIGPLHASASGNRWILVASDHLTRYAETCALPNATADHIAHFFLTNILLRHGAPQTLLSDRGRVFLSTLVQELLQACNVIHRTTPAYHPQTNGLTEKLNRTLVDMLAMYTDLHQTNWDKVLPFITFAYNTSTHTTTGFSPFFLLFGREASCTLDTVLPYRSDFTEHQSVSDMASYAEECRQLARLQTTRAQADQKRRYDNHHRDISFETGDLVWLSVPQRHIGLSQKLLDKYLGPYRILDRTSPVNYIVEPLQVPQDHRRRNRDIVHVSRLKNYYPPPEPQ